MAIIRSKKMSPEAILAGLTVSLAFCKVKIENSMNEMQNVEKNIND
jgi:hypothetical protein